MKTFKDMQDTYREKREELRKNYINDLQNHFKELGLDGVVKCQIPNDDKLFRSIKDLNGREGVIKIENEYTQIVPKFYPFTSKGEVGKYAKGYINFEDLDKGYFVPVNKDLEKDVPEEEMER